MTGLSFFAVNQAGDRRYTSQAEDFLVWLEQLSDMAMLEGTAYGISGDEDGLQALVYFNYNWYRVSVPAAFQFQDTVELSLMNGQQAKSINDSGTGADGSRIVVPDIIMLPDGYMDPSPDLALAFENFSPVFRYHQSDTGFSLVLDRGR